MLDYTTRMHMRRKPDRRSEAPEVTYSIRDLALLALRLTGRIIWLIVSGLC